MVSQLNINNALMYKVTFISTWLDVHRSQKLIQLFQVGVVRHGYACPTCFKTMSQLYLKNALSYEVDFLHEFLIHSYGCGQAYLGMPKVIVNIESAICQD